MYWLTGCRLLAKALAVMPPRLAQVPTSLVEQRNAAFIRAVRHAVEQVWVGAVVVQCGNMC